MSLYWKDGTKKDWKDLRLAAITRLSKRKGWSMGDSNPYFEQVYNVILNKNILTKQQCKEECKKHGYR